MNEGDTMPVIEQSVVDALRAAARDHNIGSFLTEVAAHDMAAAVRDAEVERLREALRWYANADNFPHPDYAARAKAALNA